MNTLLKRVPWRVWILTGVTVLVYFLSLRNGFIWDDEAYVLENYALKNLQGLWDIWFRPWDLVQYYPLTFSSLWINFQIGGVNPFGYHLVNLILQCCNGILLWRLLERLKVPGAWFAALVFMIHPVHVESVAWVTERKNVLSGFFYLSAMISYFRFKDEKKWLWYFASYLLFLCATFSKTVTGTFPLTLLILLWWKERKIPVSDALKLIPFFATGAYLSLITVNFETGHIDSMGAEEWHFTFPERFLIAGRALWFYLGKLVWPHPLTFIYPRWDINASVPWQWIFPISYFSGLLTLWIFRNRLGRGTFAAFLIFFVTLLPALGFRSFYPMRFSFVADHFQYLASIAPISFVVAVVYTKVTNARIRTALGILVISIFSLLSFKQTFIYQNLETLWRDTLAKNPNAWMAHNNLGTVLLQSGRDQEAETHFRESIRLKLDFADPFTNIGNIRAREGNYIKAKQYYRRALELQSNNADFQNNVGTAYYEMGFPDKAIPYYLKALELNPKNIPAHYNMGNAFLKKGKIKETIPWYRKVIELNPEYTDAYVNLGTSLSALGQTDEAIKLYKTALSIKPNEPAIHNNLANVLAALDRSKEADFHYRESVRLGPNVPLFRNNFASFLIQQGKIDEAIEQYNEVIRIDPKNPEAQRHIRRLAFSF